MKISIIRTNHTRLISSNKTNDQTGLISSNGTNDQTLKLTTLIPSSRTNNQPELAFPSLQTNVQRN